MICNGLWKYKKINAFVFGVKIYILLISSKMSVVGCFKDVRRLRCSALMDILEVYVVIFIRILISKQKMFSRRFELPRFWVVFLNFRFFCVSFLKSDVVSPTTCMFFSRIRRSHFSLS